MILKKFKKNLFKNLLVKFILRTVLRKNEGIQNLTFCLKNPLFKLKVTFAVKQVDPSQKKIVMLTYHNTGFNYIVSIVRDPSI